MLKILNVIDFESWEEDIRYLLDKYISKDSIATIKKNPPEYLYSDDFDWLDDVISLETGEDSDIRELLAELLVSEYTHIKAFHATRIDDAKLFYDRGIIPTRYEDIITKVKKIFNSIDFPEISDNQLNSAIEESRKYSTGEVWFHLNKTYLINPQNCSNHYLKYGSELIQSIAVNIANTEYYKFKLQNYGEPIIFECSVPINEIDFSYLKALSGVIISEFFYSILGRYEGVDDLKNIDSSIVIKKPLLPKNIIGHEVILCYK